MVMAAQPAHGRAPVKHPTPPPSAAVRPGDNLGVQPDRHGCVLVRALGWPAPTRSWLPELRDDCRPSCRHLLGRRAARSVKGELRSLLHRAQPQFRYVLKIGSNGLTFRLSKRGFDVTFREGVADPHIRQ